MRSKLSVARGPIKVRTYMVLLASAALVLSACGSNAGQGTSNSSTANTSTGEATGSGPATSPAGAGTSQQSSSSEPSTPQSSKATADTGGSLNSLLPASVRTSGKLVIATDASYPVCESMDQTTNEMVGFEPDIWNAMGKVLGVQIEPVNTAFDGLIPGVQSGRYPAAMECISDNPDREKVVTFIDFIYGQASIFALKSAADAGKVTEDPLSICGLTGAAAKGTDFAGYLKNILSAHCTKNGKPPLKISLLPSGSQVELAVYSGRADFAIDDTASVAYLIEHAPKPLALIPNDLLPKSYLGIITKPDAKDLQTALLRALEAIQASGEYASIMKKWDIGHLALVPPGINLATNKPIKNPTI